MKDILTSYLKRKPVAGGGGALIVGILAVVQDVPVEKLWPIVVLLVTYLLVEGAVDALGALKGAKDNERDEDAS